MIVAAMANAEAEAESSMISPEFPQFRPETRTGIAVRRRKGQVTMTSRHSPTTWVRFTAVIVLILLAVPGFVQTEAGRSAPGPTTQRGQRALTDLEIKGLNWQNFQKAPFASKLEYILDSGLLAKDKRATDACVALLFAEDSWIVRIVGGLALERFELVGREVLSASVERVEKNRALRKSKAAAQRLCMLLGLAVKADKPYVYLDLLIEHIDARWCQLDSLSDLYLIRTAFAKAFPTLPQPPQVPVVKEAAHRLRITWPPERDNKEVAKLKAQWRKWLDGADRDKVKRTIRSWFKAGRGRDLQEKPAEANGNNSDATPQGSSDKTEGTRS